LKRQPRERYGSYLLLSLERGDRKAESVVASEVREPLAYLKRAVTVRQNALRTAGKAAAALSFICGSRFGAFCETTGEG
jgi:hypothetical protein